MSDDVKPLDAVEPEPEAPDDGAEPPEAEGGEDASAPSTPAGEDAPARSRMATLMEGELQKKHNQWTMSEYVGEAWWDKRWFVMVSAHRL